MKRHLQLLLLSAALGVVANVGTAWWCALRLDPFQAQATTAYLLDAGDWVRLRRWESLAVTLACTRRLSDLSLRNMDDTEIEPIPSWQLGPASELTVTDRCADGRGWPLISMYSEWSELPDPTSPARQRTIRGGIETSAKRNLAGLPPVLPLRPIWPAFAYDSLLFMVPFWIGLAASSMLRRRARRRRGECLECGYPTDGLAVCPECGAPR